MSSTLRNTIFEFASETREYIASPSQLARYVQFRLSGISLWRRNYNQRACWSYYCCVREYRIAITINALYKFDCIQREFIGLLLRASSFLQLLLSCENILHLQHKWRPSFSFQYADSLSFIVPVKSSNSDKGKATRNFTYTACARSFQKQENCYVDLMLPRYFKVYRYKETSYSWKATKYSHHC